jgi:hypothetical protein
VTLDLGIVLLSRDAHTRDSDDWVRLVKRALPFDTRVIELGAPPPLRAESDAVDVQPVHFGRVHHEGASGGWHALVTRFDHMSLGPDRANDAARGVLRELISHSWLHFGYFTTVLDQLEPEWMQASLFPEGRKLSQHYRLIALPRSTTMSVDNEPYLPVDHSAAGTVSRRRHDPPKGPKARMAVVDGLEHGLYASTDGPVLYAGERRFLLAFGDYRARWMETRPDVAHFSLERSGERVYEISYRPPYSDAPDVTGDDLLLQLAGEIGTAELNRDNTLPSSAAAASSAPEEDRDPDGYRGPTWFSTHPKVPGVPHVSDPDYTGLDYGDDY